MWRGMAGAPASPPPLVDRQEEVARTAEALDAAERGEAMAAKLLGMFRGKAKCPGRTS